ncbi:hypothetical protein K1719_024666 [Acacia pycnantha]|nr:hypothetical protein K1719_024666 [Acacia pycnantha]
MKMFISTIVQNQWLFHRTAHVKACSTSHDFFDVPKNWIEQEIDSIFSSFDVPQDFRNQVATKILDFAANMTNNTHKDKKHLYMRVDLHVAHHGSINDYEQAVQESLEDDLPLR